MVAYKCDACGNAVCWCEPKEAWGEPHGCPYDVGVPVNWRKARRQRTTGKAHKNNGEKMAVKKVNVCTICGSKKCNGKEYRAHIKYDYYEKVDYWKTVCYSQTTNNVCSYMVTEETENPNFLNKGKRYYTFGLCTGMNYATEAIPKEKRRG